MWFHGFYSFQDGFSLFQVGYSLFQDRFSRFQVFLWFFLVTAWFLSELMAKGRFEHPKRYLLDLYLGPTILPAGPALDL